MLRRLKLDVEHSLKPKKETKLYLGMSDLQKDLYQKLLMKDIDAINGTSPAPPPPPPRAYLVSCQHTERAPGRP